MNHSEMGSGNNGANTIQADWDVETITDQIFRDLNGAVTHSRIQEVLKDVIPKYKSARIQIYVPIFIRRDTVKQLKSMQAPFAAPDLAVNGADTRKESRAISDPSLRRIDRDEKDKTTGTGLINWKPPARGELMETTG